MLMHHLICSYNLRQGSSDTAKSRGFKWKNRPCKGSAGSAGGNPRVLDVPFEDLAAIRIQTAFRAYMKLDAEESPFTGGGFLRSYSNGLQVEWCGGSDTREEILARIHQREEAAVKRERAMAYAFSHQKVADINCAMYSQSGLLE
ncbi:hypothetical protein GH714_015645 [Hevea brasiliensis]|uniref:Uncharacterized protein n=1 Tax=Hevea brasiliensis TaxID=3981 RepID=A0A6A6LRU8_HEVBR|nr:hypothetical protein GH714_015645 [Hevea brasiliensis]